MRLILIYIIYFSFLDKIDVVCFIVSAKLSKLICKMLNNKVVFVSMYSNFKKNDISADLKDVKFIYKLKILRKVLQINNI